MKILESAPSRYDKGIRLLTFGQVNKAYDRLVTKIKAGQKVLDIGCGTGALTLRAAKKGAKVKAIDVNTQMMEIAQQQISQAYLSQNVKFCEMGVGELNDEKSENYDVVMSGLCFSELSYDELHYTLSEVKRLLKTGGFLLIGDEVRPENFFKRIIYWAMRLPLVLITYIITQTTTHAIKNLPKKIMQAGFFIESIKLNGMESFIELIAKKPEKK